MRKPIVQTFLNLLDKKVPKRDFCGGLHCKPFNRKSKGFLSSFQQKPIQERRVAQMKHSLEPKDETVLPKEKQIMISLVFKNSSWSEHATELRYISPKFTKKKFNAQLEYENFFVCLENIQHALPLGVVSKAASFTDLANMH